jgi:hypothetical protein
MAVVIKSGNSSDLGTIDPISKALRVTNYYPDGTFHDHLPTVLTINPVTAVNNDILASFDTEDYKYVSLQLTGTWVGTVEFQGSNDNGTFENIVVQNTGVVLEPYVLSMTVNGGVKIPVLFKFLRVRVTSYTSGSVTGTAFGYKEDANTGQISTVGTVQIAAGQSVSLSASTASIGKVSIATNTTLQTLFVVGQGGAVNVNSASVVAAPATLRAVAFTNYTAGARHFKIYNTASVPVAGVGIPFIVVSLPAGGTFAFPIPLEGLFFSDGIGYTMTGGAANSDVTPTATSPDFTVNLVYAV